MILLPKTRNEANNNNLFLKVYLNFLEVCFYFDVFSFPIQIDKKLETPILGLLLLLKRI